MLVPILTHILGCLAAHLTLTVALPQQTFRTGTHHSLPPGLDLLQTSIQEIQSFMANGTLSSVQLVQAYLGERDATQSSDCPCEC
jgi:hypothetical protein